MLAILCIQLFVMFVGLGIMLTLPARLFGRSIRPGRRFLIGLLLFVQTPLGLALSSWALADAGPGPIEGAAPEDAAARIAALCIEWTFLLGSIVAAIGLALAAPRAEDDIPLTPTQESETA